MFCKVYVYYSKLAKYTAACNCIMLVSYAAVNIIMHTAVVCTISHCSIRVHQSVFQWTLTNMNICYMGLPDIWLA